MAKDALKTTLQQLGMMALVAAGSTGGYRAFVEPKVSSADSVSVESAPAFAHKTY